MRRTKVGFRLARTTNKKCANFKNLRHTGFNSRVLKQLRQYPNPPKPSKIAVFLCCRSQNTPVLLRPSALKKRQFYLVLGSMNFRCSVFASMRGKNTANADAFASILTMQWRKNPTRNEFGY